MWLLPGQTSACFRQADSLKTHRGPENEAVALEQVDKPQREGRPPRTRALTARAWGGSLALLFLDCEPACVLTSRFLTSSALGPSRCIRLPIRPLQGVPQASSYTG